MNKNYQELRAAVEELSALTHAIAVLNYDMATQAPKASFGHIATTLERLTALYVEGITSESFLALLDAAAKEPLSADEAALVRVLQRELEEITCVPRAEYLAKVALNVEAEQKWMEARDAKDFSVFAPALEKLVTYARKYTKYKGYKEHPFDALLDMYEPGMTVASYDAFFANVREQLVPFIQELKENPMMQETLAKNLTIGDFSIQKQMELMPFIAKSIGYDFNRGLLSTSTHPFSEAMNTDDARITTKYLSNDVTSSIFSIMHEVGHARYQNNISPKFERTPLNAGASMGMHESQSRFFENIIGRSFAFWDKNYAAVQAYFPQAYGDVPLADFVRAINSVEPSLIRVEADEVTYPLHIMVRYELEKQLVEGALQVEELPNAWNDMMEAYLGVRPANDLEGVLQDIHWTDGGFGYFPTYALGSAYSAQMYHAMQQAFDVSASLQENGMRDVEAYLAEHVHQYGASKLPAEIIEQMSGEAFNSQYYIDYLIEKYRTLFSKN